MPLLLFCRSNFLPLISYDNILKVEEKGLFFYEQPFRNSDNFPLILPAGVMSNQFSYTSFYIHNESKPVVVSKSISEYEQIGSPQLSCLIHYHAGKIALRIKKATNFYISRLCTPDREYFEHLERFLMILEPVILDLKGRGLLK